ncbi:acylphosphatase [Maridesulfovibrio hydrothermalis]|uniref:acylphosphatase n=1 Tax=Maridesulfovibrio hydrothermalis AM13 = DSM 14728 TaxID=1121451 RepID=L0R733_9BACT|nr:acylphosphatase [Maridesulfovibrio hydrothermalis]CCO22549.1 Acylphosphatase [Maridesulfovibrio hydrothermalis AM13 = DSM 14728]
MIRSYHCVVTGKVQGVFFRAWVSDQAAALKLGGWTRNLDEGKVEVLMQGDETNIAEMRTRLLVGPPLSQVKDLKCEWIDYDTEHKAFEIR